MTNIKKILLLIFILFITGCGNTSKITIDLEFYNNSTFISSTKEEVNKYIEDKKSFIIYTYNNYCIFSTPCESIFQEFIDKYNIGIVSIPYSEFKGTSLYNKVKYAPSIIIVNKGKVYAYLDPDKEDDLIKYQDVDEFINWCNKYINM